MLIHAIAEAFYLPDVDGQYTTPAALRHIGVLIPACRLIRRAHDRLQFAGKMKRHWQSERGLEVEIETTDPAVIADLKAYRLRGLSPAWEISRKEGAPLRPVVDITAYRELSMTPRPACPWRCFLRVSYDGSTWQAFDKWIDAPEMLRNAARWKIERVSDPLFRRMAARPNYDQDAEGTARNALEIVTLYERLGDESRRDKKTDFDGSAFAAA